MPKGLKKALAVDKTVSKAKSPVAKKKAATAPETPENGFPEVECSFLYPRASARGVNGELVNAPNPKVLVKISAKRINQAKKATIPAEALQTYAEVLCAQYRLENVLVAPAQYIAGLPTRAWQETLSTLVSIRESLDGRAPLAFAASPYRQTGMLYARHYESISDDDLVYYHGKIVTDLAVLDKFTNQRRPVFRSTSLGKKEKNALCVFWRRVNGTKIESVLVPIHNLLFMLEPNSAENAEIDSYAKIFESCGSDLYAKLHA